MRSVPSFKHHFNNRRRPEDDAKSHRALPSWLTPQVRRARDQFRAFARGEVTPLGGAAGARRLLELAKADALNLVDPPFLANYHFKCKVTRLLLRLAYHVCGWWNGGAFLGSHEEQARLAVLLGSAKCSTKSVQRGWKEAASVTGLVKVEPRWRPAGVHGGRFRRKWRGLNQVVLTLAGQVAWDEWRKVMELPKGQRLAASKQRKAGIAARVVAAGGTPPAMCVDKKSRHTEVQREVLLPLRSGTGGPRTDKVSSLRSDSTESREEGQQKAGQSASAVGSARPSLSVEEYHAKRRTREQSDFERAEAACSTKEEVDELYRRQYAAWFGGAA